MIAYSIKDIYIYLLKYEGWYAHTQWQDGDDVVVQIAPPYPPGDELSFIVRLEPIEP